MHIILVICLFGTNCRRLVDWTTADYYRLSENVRNKYLITITEENKNYITILFNCKIVTKKNEPVTYLLKILDSHKKDGNILKSVITFSYCVATQLTAVSVQFS